MSGVAIITGASSGLGRGLARELSRDGWSVGLIARRVERLDELVAEITSTGGTAACERADVTDRALLRSAIESLEARLGPCEMMVANAGVSCGSSGVDLDASAVVKEFSVNVFGVIHSIEAVLPGMCERGAGHVVVVSSLAGYRGMPGAAGYCASKSAVTRFMEGIRTELSAAGVASTTIHPGFVVSEMTDKNDFKMPFMLSTERAARKMARAIKRRKKLYEFPWPTVLLVRGFLRLLPDWAVHRWGQAKMKETL